MIIDKFLMDASNIKLVSKIVIGIFAALIMIIILLSITVLQSNKHRTVVLVPLTLNKPTTISTDSASPDYLTLMATSIVSMRFNFNPNTINDQYQAIEHYISPDSYTQIANDLDSEAKSMINQDIQSSFAVTSVQPDVDNLAVSVSGTLSRWVSGAALPTVQTTFLLKFKNQNGILFLTDWEEAKK